MRYRWGSLVFAAFVGALAALPADAQVPFQTSGNIASGAQYDLYTITLSANLAVTGTHVCDETSPGSGDRPLDPVLSVFFPGNTGWDDTINSDVFDDDSFGQDDDENGVDCNAFDSARVIFIAPVDGDYVFRADGFGSSTGPYTLTITAEAQSPLAIPTLDQVGLAGLALLLAVASIFFLRKRRAA